MSGAAAGGGGRDALHGSAGLPPLVASCICPKRASADPALPRLSPPRRPALPPPRSTLHGNRLAGTLPDGWAQPGSFQTLRQLTLSDNDLAGTLPATWGNSTIALQSLQNLNVSYCGLSGTLPPWGGEGMPGLRSLTTL